MGIRNRDYMKRSSDGDDERSSQPDAKLEAFFSGFLGKYPRFFFYLAGVIAALVIIALVVTKFSVK